MPSYRVVPAERVAGEVTIPGDKSISHRAVMFGAIASGTTRVEGFLEGEDCLATMRAVRQLGVEVERPAPGEVVVHGVGLRGLKPPASDLDMGNAGTAMRLFTGLLCAQPFDSVLVGDDSLMRRPMERAAKPLREMGARIATLDGKPPVRITGGAQLHGIRYAMPVASAQVKSAVLLAGLYAEGETTVRHARSHGTDAAELRLRRGGPQSGRDRAAAAGIARDEHPSPGRHFVGGILPRGRLHRRARTVHAARRGCQPDAYRHSRDAGADGS
jgi:5-enolpyruvylshikimate-3-phosphate synthase